MSVYIVIALLFGLWVGARWGGGFGGQFYAGWLTEYSLSLDNLFVFLIIMSRFKVPPAASRRSSWSASSSRWSCAGCSSRPARR